MSFKYMKIKAIVICRGWLAWGLQFVKREVAVLWPSCNDKHAGIPAQEYKERGEAMTEQTTARVLLVDDEEDFLKTLSDRLKVRGLRVSTSVSGEDAIVKTEEQEYDAIVVDLSMPGMDGIETMKKIKEAHPEAEIIMLTGHGSVASGVSAMKEGAMDFLEKPVEINTLLEKIGEAKNKRMLVLQEKSQEELRKIIKSQGW